MPTFTMAANGMTAVSAEFPDKNYSNLTEFTFGQTPFSDMSVVDADCAYVSFAKPAGTEKYKKIIYYI